MSTRCASARPQNIGRRSIEHDHFTRHQALIAGQIWQDEGSIVPAAEAAWFKANPASVVCVSDTLAAIQPIEPLARIAITLRDEAKRRILGIPRPYSYGRKLFWRRSELHTWLELQRVPATDAGRE